MDVRLFTSLGVLPVNEAEGILCLRARSLYEMKAEISVSDYYWLGQLEELGKKAGT